MKGFVADIEELTKDNVTFRRVMYTGQHLQLVLMALESGEEIGEEVHETNDQFFRIEKGRGEAVIDGVRTPIRSGAGIVVPAGARHNIINTGEKLMRLYTLYGPAKHRDRLVQATRAEALSSTEQFEGQTTE